MQPAVRLLDSNLLRSAARVSARAAQVRARVDGDGDFGETEDDPLRIDDFDEHFQTEAPGWGEIQKVSEVNFYKEEYQF